jgi:predicted metal-dependent hydrolase
MFQSAWPPKYTVRESFRAKRVSLRISPRKGLEIIIPKGFNTYKIARLLAEKKTWITKHLANIVPPSLPNTLVLTAINEIWDINYTATIANKVTLIPNPQNQLTIMGDIKNHALCHKIINKWLQQKAKLHLIPWLNDLSNKTGLNYQNVAIRKQQTLWGSCSAQNNINLNCKLLLLEPELVNYIIIHELCHTKYHNHSIKFWRLVEKLQPNYCDLCRKLRQYRIL